MVPGALEIGYWCHINHAGRGIITRSAGALIVQSGCYVETLVW